MFVIFAIVAILEAIAAILVYTSKKLLHSVVALALFFIINTLMFIVFYQPLFAAIQLFIMVGGVSAYIFLSVGQHMQSPLKHTNYLSMAVFSVLAFIAFFFLFSGSGITSPASIPISQPGLSSDLAIAIPFFYEMAFLLFGTSLAAVVLLMIK